MKDIVSARSTLFFFFNNETVKKNCFLLVEYSLK